MKFRQALTTAGTLALLLTLVTVAGCAGPEAVSRDPLPPSGGADPTEGGGVGTDDSPTTGEPATDPSGYVLGQGDVIGIQVFDEPDLTLQARVGSSGVINYSYLGDMQVAGRTPLELERVISRQLQDGYLVNPSVNVTVVEYRPFFINGEVRSPGSYPYQPGLTLDKAISLAGGATDRASTRKMFVIKAARGEEERQRVDMNYRVSPGDVISINEGFF